MSVTIVRDPWHDGVFSMFVPLRDGNYARWQTYDSSQTNYQALSRVGVGKVYEGKVYPMHTSVGANDWTTTGSWGSYVGSRFSYRRTDTMAATIKTVIPAGHNRIHLVAYPVAGGSDSVNIDWDNSTIDGLDLVTYDLNTNGTGVKDVVIATNASPDGVKSLRITSSGTVRLLGIKSWNTSVLGDPTTENGSGIWMGHDVVNVQRDGGYNMYAGAVAGYYHMISDTPSALEGAISWTPTGSSAKWSGGLAHIIPGNAKYTYFPSSDYLTDGPDVLVDGVDSGGMTAMTKGDVLSGDSISLVSEGFWDYDEDGTDESGVDPKVTWLISMDNLGMASSFAVQWRGSSDQVNVLYAPMILIENRDGRETTIAVDGNEYLLTGASDVILDGCASARINIPQIGYELEMFSTLPSKKQWWFSSSSKMYLQAEVSGMLNNGTIAQGDVWCFGGRWQFTKSNVGFGTRSRTSNPGRLSIIK